MQDARGGGLGFEIVEGRHRSCWGKTCKLMRLLGEKYRGAWSSVVESSSCFGAGGGARGFFAGGFRLTSDVTCVWFGKGEHELAGSFGDSSSSLHGFMFS